jgi:uncharacterized protein YodC (DUF2158 family)
VPVENIAVGSVVVLKSGGPKMTVNFFADNGNAHCSWFDSKKELQSASFSITGLRLATEDD